MHGLRLRWSVTIDYAVFAYFSGMIAVLYVDDLDGGRWRLYAIGVVAGGAAIAGAYAVRARMPSLEALPHSVVAAAGGSLLLTARGAEAGLFALPLAVGVVIFLVTSAAARMKASG